MIQALLDRATKGPWQVNGTHFYGPDPERALLGQMVGLPGGPFDANAALIALAPTLAADVIRLTAEVDALRAALVGIETKASNVCAAERRGGGLGFAVDELRPHVMIARAALDAKP